MKGTLGHKPHSSSFVLIVVWVIIWHNKSGQSSAAFALFSDMRSENKCLNFIYNPGQNICRLFHFSAQFVFTTTELDHYHQKVNVPVASRVVEQVKEYPEMLGIDGEYPAAHWKAKFWRFLVKNCKKIQL